VVAEVEEEKIALPRLPTKPAHHQAILELDWISVPATVAANGDLDPLAKKEDSEGINDKFGWLHNSSNNIRILLEGK
jgi:hypothetical protein